jgi:hypothetical protein
MVKPLRSMSSLSRWVFSAQMVLENFKICPELPGNELSEYVFYNSE